MSSGGRSIFCPTIIGNDDESVGIPTPRSDPDEIVEPTIEPEPDPIIEPAPPTPLLDDVVMSPMELPDEEDDVVVEPPPRPLLGPDGRLLLYVEGGYLKLYENEENMVCDLVAHCTNENHRPTASGTRCQITRTLLMSNTRRNAKERGQGLCVGFTTAWIKLGSKLEGEHNYRWHHVHKIHPTFLQRCEARAEFKLLPGAEDFLKLERPRLTIADGCSEDEASEPTDI